MTSPPEQIIVECPACGHCYEDWYRPSISRWLEDFSDEFIEQNSTTICPRCNCKAKLGVLISDGQELCFQQRQARFRRKTDPATYRVQIDGISPTQRVMVIKVIRSIASLELSKVKSMIENLPQTVAEARDIKQAERWKQMLEDAGAEVSLKYF